MFGDSIKVTLLKHGIALPDADALRRLRQLGFRRNQTGNTATTPRRMQTDYLAGFAAIRDVEHYKEIVGDPRSSGPMHWFHAPATLIMDLTSRSHKRDVPFYVIRDTAIGSPPDWLQELQKKKQIRIEAFD